MRRVGKTKSVEWMNVVYSVFEDVFDFAVFVLDRDERPPAGGRLSRAISESRT